MQTITARTKALILRRCKEIFREDPSGVRVNNYLDQEIRKKRIDEIDADQFFQKAEKEVYGSSMSSATISKVPESEA